MKAAAEADELPLARVRLGQAQRRFDRFRAAGIELHSMQRIGWAVSREPFHQFHSRFAGETSHGSSVELRLERCDISGMAVAEGIDADAADQVEKRIAIDVGDGAAAR